MRKNERGPWDPPKKKKKKKFKIPNLVSAQLSLHFCREKILNKKFPSTFHQLPALVQQFYPPFSVKMKKGQPRNNGIIRIRGELGGNGEIISCLEVDFGEDFLSTSLKEKDGE